MKDRGASHNSLWVRMSKRTLILLSRTLFGVIMKTFLWETFFDYLVTFFGGAFLYLDLVNF